MSLDLDAIRETLMDALSWVPTTGTQFDKAEAAVDALVGRIQELNNMVHDAAAIIAKQEVWIGRALDAEARAVKAEAERDTLREAPDLSAWFKSVTDAWLAEWRDREPPHRYTKDFAAFAGERLLNDFDLRGVLRAALTQGAGK